MAKQTGIIKITGTVADYCFYRNEGEYYVRAKSSLNGERVKNDPAFAETMRYAEIMGKASKLSSGVYQTLPKAKRRPFFFRQLVVYANQLLKQDVPEEMVKVELEQKLGELLQANQEKLL